MARVFELLLMVILIALAAGVVAYVAGRNSGGKK